MDALTLMRLDGYFVSIWTTKMGFAGVGKSCCPSTCVGGPRQQNHHAMNVRILSHPYARQKRNEKKALDRVKKKVELEWDEL